MQGINLARRPFVNRRPVLRLAILLWIAGVLLAMLNVKQYTEHWQGTRVNRQRLAKVEAEVREAREELRQLDPVLARVGIVGQNRRAEFLNHLIASRTFPWSALFDDLEDVLPLDVRLLSVKPSVKLAAEPAAPRRPQRATSRRPRSASRRATAGSGEAAAAGDDGTAGGEAPEETPLRRNEVQLKLNVVGRTEDALLELIEAFYADPSFRAPFVPGENIKGDGGVQFSATVLYLTRRPGEEPEPALAAEELPAAVAGSPAAEGEGSATVAAGATRVEDDPEVAEGETTAAAQPPAGPGARRPAGSEAAAEAGGAPESGSRRGRAGSAEPEAGATAERGRGSRQRTLTGSTAGVAVPGAAGSGSGGTSGPGTSAPGAAESPRPDSSGAAETPRAPGNQRPEDPEFAQPAASATPRLQHGTFHSPPKGRRPLFWSQTRRFPWEAVA